MAKILIVDDEASILNLMTKLCDQLGHETIGCLTGTEGREKLETEKPDLMIVDLRIGDISGLELIEFAKKANPATQIIMVTGYGTVETAVEAMKLGAFDYLTKPFELEDLRRSVNRALATTGEAPVPPVAIDPGVVPGIQTTKIIGESEKMKEVLAAVEKIADISRPVLLEGEFGTGKHAISRAIHDAGGRSELPFKFLQCSSLSEELLEQELFGTADGGTRTLFERAHGGTVLLEEVDLLPLRLQSQLGAFLEELDDMRIRGQLTPDLDFRLIASSNQDLKALVDKGEFREDLYYHLSIIPLHLPPVRHREGDIELLAEHFLGNYAKLTRTKPKVLDKFAKGFIEKYAWPGNVGELQNAIERACALAEDERVRPVDLPPSVTKKIEVTDDEEASLKHKLPIGSKLSDYIKKQEKIFIRETLKYNEGSRRRPPACSGLASPPSTARWGSSCNGRRLSWRIDPLEPIPDRKIRS